ncbi:hypothetical protein [Amycolatopsis jejuensis]|uniref:hypothetical protein n=1 Tax=Amycolatopsis jejuensis TaxID=330084 RepID=UPI0012E01D7F|nr:hypothetical protein [Amycolatopsis jejuensis]
MTRRAVPSSRTRTRHRRPRAAKQDIVRHLHPVRYQEVRPEHDPVRVRERLALHRHLALVPAEHSGVRRGAA